METGSSGKRTAGGAVRSKTPRNGMSGWRKRFLETLGETSNVSKAAQAAKRTPGHIYRTKRRDSEFARQWHEALLEGYEHLELEVLDRMRHGIPTDDSERKFDNGAAMRLLAQHRETVEKLRAQHDTRSEIDVVDEINARIDRIRAREADPGPIGR